jgi:hypothetical protein
VADVLFCALREQLHSGEPWLIIGAPYVLLEWLLFACAMLYRFPDVGATADAAIATALKLGSIAAVFAAGCWTAVRRPGAGSGRAAMKLCALLGSPQTILALLALAGVVRFVPVFSGQSFDPGEFRGIAIGFYATSAGQTAGWYSLKLMRAALVALPYAGAIGWAGGALVRVIRKGQQRLAVR